MALTELEIRRAKAKDKAYSMSDGGGLYLWITVPEGRLWRWSYRCAGKEKLMSLGKYPDGIVNLTVRCATSSEQEVVVSGCSTEVPPQESQRTRV